MRLCSAAFNNLKNPSILMGLHLHPLRPGDNGASRNLLLPNLEEDDGLVEITCVVLPETARLSRLNCEAAPHAVQR